MAAWWEERREGEREGRDKGNLMGGISCEGRHRYVAASSQSVTEGASSPDPHLTSRPRRRRRRGCRLYKQGVLCCLFCRLMHSLELFPMTSSRIEEPFVNGHSGRYNPFFAVLVRAYQGKPIASPWSATTHSFIAALLRKQA